MYSCHAATALRRASEGRTIAVNGGFPFVLAGTRHRNRDRSDDHRPEMKKRITTMARPNRKSISVDASRHKTRNRRSRQLTRLLSRISLMSGGGRVEMRGSSILEEALNRHPVSVMFQSHAHGGSPKGHTSRQIPVCNVSLSSMKRFFSEKAPLDKTYK
jgi:hypothetical protein